MKLRNLPKELRQAAWANAKAQGCQMPYSRARSWAIRTLFIFEDTPEGHDFWAKIQYDRILPNTLKETFIKVLEDIKQPDWSWFICLSLNKIYNRKEITLQEYEEASAYLHANKPSKDLHSEFMGETFFGNGAWWWHKDQEVRIKFLKKLISQL